MTDVPDSLTVPTLAPLVGKPVDSLRRLLRGRPDLAAMFTRIGATRMLPRAKVEEFRQTMERPVTVADQVDDVIPLPDVSGHSVTGASFPGVAVVRSAEIRNGEALYEVECHDGSRRRVKARSCVSYVPRPGEVVPRA